VAFFRFSRDKRGYEYFYLVEPVTNRKGKSRSRVLYWYRTPPNVKVGRVPFDDEVRRALEARYPNVAFDWTQIVEAPIPSAEPEKWRERRRAERVERATRRSTPDEENEATEEAAPQEPDAAIDARADIPAESTDAAPPSGESPRTDALRKRRRRRGRAHVPANAADARSEAEPSDVTTTSTADPEPEIATSADDSITDPSGE
jgi:hypothetical protein